ncbi:cytochrome P450 710A1-like [Oryza glaberrima]|uniref:cytochrome P450 710A1-like n=1 Tax=Oryza glaberrima TaxID=4538 RepID=UPI00224C5253|nr:cytochrome P450 710A1-like [Oryza glaberrima]
MGTRTNPPGSMVESFHGLVVVDLRTAAPLLATAVALYILIEQLSYHRKKGSMPGPPLVVVPFLGSVTHLFRDPVGFWDLQATRASKSGAGLTADFLFGRLMVFIRDSELSRRVFANVRADAFHLVGHPFGKKLFGDHNLIYMVGKEHKDLRRRIAPNFSPRALSTYAVIQQRVILSHLRRWIDRSVANGGKAEPIRVPCRDMNLETSQTVFVGPYLTVETRERFDRDYNLFNHGFITFPIDLPGSAFRRARLAVPRLKHILEDCARQSKQRMRGGGEPECLVDYLMQETVREIDEAAAAGLPPPPHTSDMETGNLLFDFLFAAQDASTSSLCWAVSALDSHPDVLARVRAEVAALWSPESGEPITAEMMTEMKYTQAVAREVVRYWPPGPVVPHIAGEAFQLTEQYTIPKGTIVFPSVYESSFQGFPDAGTFDPERFFSEARREDVVYKRNFLAFGAGPHQCVGQRYALNHLVIFMALLASLIDFRRERTEGCDVPVYMPTMVPRDGCVVHLKQRCAKLPSF